jgi:transposase-like protein
MGCPYCGRTDIERASRSGLIDAIFGLFSKRPYRCRACWRRFHRERGGSRISEGKETRSANALYRRSGDTPTAAVVIQAESSQQLTNILLALSDAVRREEAPAPEKVSR